LRFAVWSQPWDGSVLSADSHFLADQVSKNMRVWVKGFLIPFIGGISEHESLISSTHIELILLSMDSSGNVGILSVNVKDNIAISSVKTNILTGEAYILADLSSNLLEVDL